MAQLPDKILTTKKGTKALLMSPTSTDAAALLETMQTIIKTSPHLLTTIEEFKYTVELQEKRIQDHLDHQDKLIITLKIDDRFVGMLDFSPGHRSRIAHYGEFGISLLSEYQGMGIGQMMMEALMSWAKSNPRIETVRLKVHSQNRPAISMYEKCGFVLEGKEVRGIKFSDGTYDDVLAMACDVRS